MSQVRSRFSQIMVQCVKMCQIMTNNCKQSIFFFQIDVSTQSKLKLLEQKSNTVEWTSKFVLCLATKEATPYFIQRFFTQSHEPLSLKGIHPTLCSKGLLDTWDEHKAGPFCKVGPTKSMLKLSNLIIMLQNVIEVTLTVVGRQFQPSKNILNKI